MQGPGHTGWGGALSPVSEKVVEPVQTRVGRGLLGVLGKIVSPFLASTLLISQSWCHIQQDNAGESPTKSANHLSNVRFSFSWYSSRPS